MLFQSNVSDRYPLAPPELPGFTATMDNSDLHESYPLHSWVRLVPRGCLHGGGFMDLLCYRSLPISGSKCSKTPGCPPVLAIYAPSGFCLRALQYDRPIPIRHFRSSITSGSAFSVTFIPRQVSCLRFNLHVTMETARLDTVPVASGYTGRLPTYWIERHRRAATET